jgi:two-component system sensor histidine kinase DegS
MYGYPSIERGAGVAQTVLRQTEQDRWRRVPDAREHRLDDLRQSAIDAIRALEVRMALLVEEATEIIDDLDHERGQVQREREERDILFSLGGGLTDIVDAPDADDLRALERELTEETFHARGIAHNLSDFSGVLSVSRRNLEDRDELLDFDDAAQITLRLAEMRALEAERRRFARDIHDGPAQAFANAIIGLEFVERAIRIGGENPQERALNEIERIKGSLREGLTEIRRFIFDLRPTMLQDRGLVPTLEHYVATYQSIFPMVVELVVDPDLPKLTGDQELACFRTIQESIQNASKHARASHVIVEMHHNGDQSIELRVRDDGRGFNPERVREHGMGGAGLNGMRERAELIGGVLEIVSAPGEGTTIGMTIPVTAPNLEPATN